VLRTCTVKDLSFNQTFVERNQMHDKEIYELVILRQTDFDMFDTYTANSNYGPASYGVYTDNPIHVLLICFFTEMTN
jgi:hypothetical protein